MQDLPERKTNRLHGYDYSRAGCYFVTICVNDRQNILWEHEPVGANCVRPCLSKEGSIVENEISVLSGTYKGVSVNKYVIMPNHIHMILVFSTIDIQIDASGRTQFAPTVSRVIKQFKGSITKKIGYSIWQKSFHDHIVRDNDEYERIWQYIDLNPDNWKDDLYYLSHR